MQFKSEEQSRVSEICFPTETLACLTLRAKCAAHTHTHTTLHLNHTAITMSAPIKPPQLDPNQTYLHITSPLSPTEITQQAQTRDITLTYIAPVGELKGEYIFELSPGSLQPSLEHGTDGSVSEASLERRDGVARDLRGVEGIKGAKVMEQKQRAKR